MSDNARLVITFVSIVIICVNVYLIYLNTRRRKP